MAIMRRKLVQATETCKTLYRTNAGVLHGEGIFSLGCDARDRRVRLYARKRQRGPAEKDQAPYLSSLARVVPISAGVDATAIPAAFSAAILSLAAPLPPEMIAPAWPMRLPGGAV